MPDLNESSLEELLAKAARYRLRPTQLLVQRGRIVRVRLFRWFWVGLDGRYWGILGPFCWQRSARAAAASAELPTALGYVRLQTLVDYGILDQLSPDLIVQLLGEYPGR